MDSTYSPSQRDSPLYEETELVDPLVAYDLVASTFPYSDLETPD
jgi:hypothetical protein